jgi:hypothetical protein
MRERLLAAAARLSVLDRRWVFLAILLAVALPFLVPVPFRAATGEQTRRFDRELGELIADPRPLLIGVDFGPQTMAELDPVLLGVLHRVFAARKRAVFLTFLPEAAAPLRAHLAAMEARYGLVYGRDYAFLGYASSYAYTMYGMGESIRDYFHRDDRQIPYEDLAVLRGVESYRDLAGIVNVASNAMPKFWIQYAVAPFGVRLLVACTAVQATDYYPYLQTGQVRGLLGGGRAGAEYEGMLLDEGVLATAGDATRGLGSQSLALLSILLFIVLGNLGYFAARRRAGRGPDVR